MQVELKRLHLEHAAGIDALPVLYDMPTPPERVKYIAYGDETTAGWCAAHSYAQARRIADLPYGALRLLPAPFREALPSC